MSLLHNICLLQEYCKAALKREYAKAEEVLSCVVGFVKQFLLVKGVTQLHI